MNDNDLRPAPTPEEVPTPTEEWRPSNKEALREFEIGIRFLNRGCIVRVGCKEIAFEDVKEAMNEINAYVCGDTWEVQKKWRAILDN